MLPQKYFPKTTNLNSQVAPRESLEREKKMQEKISNTCTAVSTTWQNTKDVAFLRNHTKDKTSIQHKSNGAILLQDFNSVPKIVTEGSKTTHNQEFQTQTQRVTFRFLICRHSKILNVSCLVIKCCKKPNEHIGEKSFTSSDSRDQLNHRTRGTGYTY